MQFRIDYCDMREHGHRVVAYAYCREAAGEEDPRSWNVGMEYADALAVGPNYVKGEPPAGAHRFFRIYINITDTHKLTSKSMPGYLRLDFNPLYNAAVAELMEIYRLIKHNWRHGLLAARESKKQK